VVDQWLAHLKFSPFMASEFDFAPLPQDPKRNGIFIAELVAYLNPGEAVGMQLSQPKFINQAPITVQDCLTNYRKVFASISVLSKNKRTPFPQRLLT